MEKRKSKVTIVGSTYAHVGYQFIYEAKLPECESCSIEKVCHNLEPGKRYEIVAIRAASHACPVHLKGVVTVDVVPATIEMRLPPNLAKKNTTITIKLQKCDETCRQYFECHPAGVVNGQRYIVTKILNTDEVMCHEGLAPVLVQMIPLPDALPLYST